MSQLEGRPTDEKPLHLESCCAERAVLRAAGQLHVLVGGQPVVPGGHRLQAAVTEHCRLAFTTQDVQCRAGERQSVLVQQLNAQGYPIQVGRAYLRLDLS